MAALPLTTAPAPATYTPANATEHKALILLGDGHPQEAVANALGVTAGRISQLMGVPEFAAEVARRKYETLASKATRDALIDEIEDSLLVKLKRSLPLLQKPEAIAKIWKDVNAAKRSSQAAAQSGNTLINNTVVNLTIPEALIRKYKTNEMAQVIEVDDKPFITAPSNQLEHILNDSISRVSADSTGADSPATARETSAGTKVARLQSPISAEDL